MAAPLRDGSGRVIAALDVTERAAETPAGALTGDYLLRRAQPGLAAS